MTDSFSGMSGGRSLPQSKYGLCTTDLGTYGALSSSLREFSSPKVYGKHAWSQSTSPSTALAYGSRSSLAGLQRWPCPGPTARGPGSRSAARADVGR